MVEPEEEMLTMRPRPVSLARVLMITLDAGREVVGCAG